MSAEGPPAAPQRSQVARPEPTLGARPALVPAGLLAPEPAIVAAIAAAVELCWPRPGAAGAGGRRPPRSGPEYVWRFSGRWWNKPVAARRDRPWTDR